MTLPQYILQPCGVHAAVLEGGRVYLPMDPVGTDQDMAFMMH